MSSKNFRGDINGLRAIAVISVVLFHFGISGFSGGFIGVDIFFVISGFLMTAIITKGISGDNFSFLGFYLARARRIIPALFILTIVLLIIGWFYLSPNDYTRLARETDRALLFLSNSYYFKRSGYFDPDSHERLLLHTWSLSVEWQFYIIYPIILFSISKVNRKLLPVSIVILFLVSFLYSVIKSYQDPTYAFYMIPSRAWEMLLGGIVFYLSLYKISNNKLYFLHYLGAVLIVLSVFIYDSATVWPGIPALLPTIGTALIIYAGKDSLFTSNYIFKKLGEWSYSIYLWHWPLAVFVFIFDISQGFYISLSLISLSVFLGAISYYVVENPTRKYLTAASIPTVIALIVIPLACVFVVVKNIRDEKGMIERLPDNVYSVFEQANNTYKIMDNCHDNRSAGGDCSYGNGNLGVIVLGDSHGMSLVGSVVEVFSGSKVLDWTHSGCPTIRNVLSTDKNNSRCSDFLMPRLDSLSKYNRVPVIISNRYSAHFLGNNENTTNTQKPNLYINEPYSKYSDDYIDEMYNGYVETLCRISETNPVYLFKPTPELKLNVPEVMGRSLLLGNNEKRIYISLSEYRERNSMALRMLEEVSEQCGITLVDPVPYLCDKNNCYGDLDGIPTYYDDDHLSMRGSDLLKPIFEKILLEN